MQAVTATKSAIRTTVSLVHKVIFLITHRISTIQQANQIMYLDKGRIQESGSHSELISITGGYYRRFVEQESEAAETSGET